MSPAFRSKGITLGLFSTVVEDKLNKLVDPTTPVDPKSCDELDARFSASNQSAEAQKGKWLAAAFADNAAFSIRLSAYDSERRRLGCGGMAFRPNPPDRGPEDFNTAGAGAGATVATATATR